MTEIEISEKGFEPSLIFLARGGVVKNRPGENEMLQQLLSAKDLQQTLKLTLTDRRARFISQTKFISFIFLSKISERGNFNGFKFVENWPAIFFWSGIYAGMD